MALVWLSACWWSSATGSLGAELTRNRETGELHVREVPDDSAAQQAGLVPGDHIKMIDGELVDGLSKEQIRARLHGEVGTTMRLTVIRGEEVLHLEVVRAEGKVVPPKPTEEPIE